ncbi:MAG: hypothetical protein GY761_02450 [Hyphomicrobiales bacterium]|nr:hypothetical protein [Hyphomicrobiales bacterium]
MIDNSTKILPVLRDDISIRAGAPDRNGVSNWVVYDPLQHRYFQINRETRDLIAILQTRKTAAELISIARHELKTKIDHTQVERLLEFLQNRQLLAEEKNDWRMHTGLEAQRSHNPMTKLMHSYLFLKVPLFHPQLMLLALLPYMRWAFTRTFFLLVGISGLISIYLVLGQWTEFVHDIQSFVSFQGAVYFGLSLILIKSLHELAHALTAVRFGCRVPTMGIAFFLLTPLLYSDVSDAWRLESRQQRLWISAAGIIIELMVACLATLLWVFLPDGAIRNTVLILASVSWIMSLFVNLNPLIKFDGYYLLADILGIDNLQQRSFAFGKWKLREILFSPAAEAPEKLSQNMCTTLTVFAWMTWTYRLILFTTIALIVYQYTFKLLGLFLMVLEIWLLILRPVGGELYHWMKMDRDRISPRRVKIVSSVFCLLIGIFFVPWSTHVSFPAKLEASRLSTIYPGNSGRIVSVNAKRGDLIQKGSPLVTLHNFEIEKKLKSAKIKLGLIKLQLANSLVEGVNHDEVLVLRRKLRSKTSEISGLLKQQQELVVRATFSGIIREFNRNIHLGRWISKTEYVALIASENSHKLRGYVRQFDIQRITDSSFGKFVPDDLTRSSFDVKLNFIAKAAVPVIEIASLASVNGGAVAVEVNARQQLVPLEAQYLIEGEPKQAIQSPRQVVLGTIELIGNAKSYASRTWNQIGKVLIREIGF